MQASGAGNSFPSRCANFPSVKMEAAIGRTRRKNPVRTIRLNRAALGDARNTIIWFQGVEGIRSAIRQRKKGVQGLSKISNCCRGNQKLSNDIDRQFLACSHAPQPLLLSQFQEPREPREPREPPQPREPPEPREPQEPQEPREPREPREPLVKATLQESLGSVRRIRHDRPWSS